MDIGNGVDGSSRLRQVPLLWRLLLVRKRQGGAPRGYVGSSSWCACARVCVRACVSLSLSLSPPPLFPLVPLPTLTVNRVRPLLYNTPTPPSHRFFSGIYDAHIELIAELPFLEEEALSGVHGTALDVVPPYDVNVLTEYGTTLAMAEELVDSTVYKARLHEMGGMVGVEVMGGMCFRSEL